jgi:hypothetical protein
MTQRVESDAGQPRAEAADGTETAYERPRILYREPLETIAALCAPSPPAKGSPGSCPRGPISS